MRKVFFYILCFSFIFHLSGLHAQAPKRYNSAEIYKKLQKLNVLGNALYVAAHPDDENTRLITYLSNAELINTAYLSLTRGDGGQNSIGPEQSELLGIIRTQELLSARRVDGGSQFFTRVMDFGYSKSADETLKIWDKQELLEDAVWIIRKFKPDVIITRFPADQRAGHGQHETSAIIAEEAYDIASDPDIFPEQLEYVDTWAPSKFYTNTGRWWSPSIEESDSVISVDIGDYDPLTGLSYSELGADSRSQHRSQAFGVTWRRGSSKEYLEFIKGIESTPGLFDGIDLTWNRIQRPDIQKEVLDIINAYDFRSPVESIPALIELRKIVLQLENGFWKNIKTKEIDEIIRACAGLYLEATSKQPYLSPGDTIEVMLELTNRSAEHIVLEGISTESLSYDTTMHLSIEHNVPFNLVINGKLDHNVMETSPYWLKEPVKNFKYDISDNSLKGLAQNPPSIEIDIKLKIQNEEVSYSIPVVYTWTDRMKGQQYEPLEIGPKVFVEIVNGVYIFPDEKEKEIIVNVDTRNQPIQGKLLLNLPEGWKTEPASSSVNLQPNGTGHFQFKLFPTETYSEGYVQAIVELDDGIYDRKSVVVDYEHFPRQAVYLPSTAKVVRLEIEKKGSKIAYIEGAGDEVGQSLEQIGYDITYVNGNTIQNIVLKDYDAIVFGIMAFNNQSYLGEYAEDFLEYMKAGGNIIVQYNNIRIGTKSPILIPYPIEFSSRSASVRVSVEDAEVRILEPGHEILNVPNKISKRDFEGWVQERGLYFPVNWDDQYNAILSSNDPGEQPLNGGLLVANYGQGHYIYTTYAWFRQLPAAVPGAYRIFANMISIGK